MAEAARSALAETASISQAVQEEIRHSTPLSAAEVIKHPAYATTEWKLEPTKCGRCQVAEGRRGGPFEISWQIHGTGKTKVVLVMGLMALHSAWKRQTRYFGHDRSSQYSCLVYDNRGIGLSDKPWTRYSTTEMAQDTLDLLQHVGWYDPNVPTRDLNIIGISMGGMISQEIALLIPNHIQSLQLISTAPRIVRTIPFIENLRQRINMFVPRQIDVQLDEIAHRLMTQEFLAKQDTENTDPKLNFSTNQDRFAAGEMQKRADTQSFTRKGFILQAIAAGWHYKSPQQLVQLRDSVGAQRMLVLHGKQDRMITFAHFEMMRADLGEEGITYIVWDDCGHLPVWEKEDEFNKTIEHMILRTGNQK